MNQAELKQYALAQDRDDPLQSLRDSFFLPTDDQQQEMTYLCGNSLGLQPKNVPSFVQQELVDWQHLGVEGHFHAQRPWMPYHEQLTEKMARVVGALPTEVICMNSLTVNLHLMMVSFYRPTSDRFKIIIEQGAFPSDRYAVESQILHHGYNVDDALIELAPRKGEDTLRVDDILAQIEQQGRELALVLLPGVQYYSGQVFDLKRITRSAHAMGSKVGWDLAHSVGNVVLALHDSQADFAVWCNYKYMNAGPGAIGGCFVHERHHDDQAIIRFAGWWGQNKTTRFQMGPVFDPIKTAEGWQLSNPPILAMAPLLASLDIFDQIGMEVLLKKAHAISGALIKYLQQHYSSDISIMTPIDDTQRGAQLSLRIAVHGKRVQQALIEAGVICDWREPDCIRIAFAPLYNNFMDLFRFTEILSTVLNEHE